MGSHGKRDVIFLEYHQSEDRVREHFQQQNIICNQFMQQNANKFITNLSKKQTNRTMKFNTLIHAQNNNNE